MIYLLVVTLIHSGVQLINKLPPQRRMFLVNSPNEAAVIIYQNFSEIPPGFDITTQLLGFDLERVTVKVVDIPRVSFKL